MICAQCLWISHFISGSSFICTKGDNDFPTSKGFCEVKTVFEKHVNYRAAHQQKRNFYGYSHCVMRGPPAAFQRPSPQLSSCDLKVPTESPGAGPGRGPGAVRSRPESRSDEAPVSAFECFAVSGMYFIVSGLTCGNE